jgi:hypothetical protein
MGIKNDIETITVFTHCGFAKFKLTPCPSLYRNRGECTAGRYLGRTK